MKDDRHYLKEELYRLFKEDPRIFDFLEEGSLDGIWYWDLEQPENEWYSPRFFQVLGYPPEESQASDWWKANIFPEDLEVARRNFDLHKADPRQPYDQIVRYRHRDGSTVWVRCRGLMIRDASGKAVRMLGAHTNVTALKRSDRFRIAMEAAPTGMLMVDSQGTIVLANSRVTSLLGYEPSEIKGQPVEILVPQAERVRHPKHREDFSRDPATRAMGAGRDLHALHKDGREIPVEIGLNPFTTEEGSFVLASIIDITERKQAELSSLAKTRELETLLYVTSHDLREPLRSIESFSSLLLDRHSDQLDEKGQDFLRRIVRATNRLDQLLDDVLMLSRAQRIEAPADTVDGREIAREALRLLEERIKETGAIVRVAADLPRFRVDRRWAIQSLYNLVSNALRFTREGQKPEIDIDKYDTDQVAGFVVRDRGPGVPPEQSERIFQLFQRAVGRNVEGTGAGLAIVSQVAACHGGKAWVEAREGGGSEFIVTFGKGVRREAAPGRKVKSCQE